jgi:tRNA A37 methylthiotransferase MiaB
MERKFSIFCRRDCPRRSLDSGTIYNYLKLNNWKATRNISRSNLIIVYTCGAFQETEQRSIQTIRRILTQKKKRADLLVTGCLVKINPEALHGIGSFHILQSSVLNELDELIKAEIPFDTVPDANTIPHVQDLDGGNRLSKAMRRLPREIRFSRTFLKRCSRFLKKSIAIQIRPQCVFPHDVYNLKISDGCLGKCTYCAIKLARGKLRSKPVERVFEEFEDGLSNGYKKFVLIAEDSGCYGLDIGIKVPHLLNRLLSVNKEYSLIINDFNVEWLIKFRDDLLPLFINKKQKLEDIRVPIQSGSDRILRLMRRRYRIDKVKEVISDFKAKMPDLKIYTDIIVGFPGETELDFKKSRKLLQNFDFAGFLVHCYEDRPGTQAYHMPEKVPLDIIEKRASTLRRL